MEEEEGEEEEEEVEVGRDRPPMMKRWPEPVMAVVRQ